MNTVLFALAGTIIGSEVVKHSQDNWFLIKTAPAANTVPSSTISHPLFDQLEVILSALGSMAATNDPSMAYMASVFTNLTMTMNELSTEFHLNTCQLYYTKQETQNQLWNMFSFLKEANTRTDMKPYYTNLGLWKFDGTDTDTASTKLLGWLSNPACANIKSAACIQHMKAEALDAGTYADGGTRKYDAPAPWFYDTQTPVPLSAQYCKISTTEMYYNELIPNILGWNDVGWLFVMYAFAILIRGVMIGVLYFPLKWSGKYGVNRANATFMWWGGLRGAVGLALAMTYYQRVTALGEVGKPEDKKRLIHAVKILFHVGFIALLTLVVQAPSSPWLMRKLGIIKTDEAQKEIHRNMLARLDDFVRLVLDSIMRAVCVCVCVLRQSYHGSGWLIGSL